MPDRHAAPHPASRWRRDRLAAAAIALVAAVGGAVVLWHTASRAPAPSTSSTSSTTAQDPAVLPPPGLLPPAPDAAAPPPIALPPGPAEDGRSADPPSGAYEPPLLSDNANLSHARRAGLHRAPNPLGLTASAVLALDARSGDVLYARNPDAILPIASLTKLMTGIVLLEAKLPLAGRIRIERADVDTLRNSRSRLRVGATLTRREALRLALMSSENRAAHALARTYPGGESAFVAAMNTKAAELGMENTRFADPTGLSNGNRATPRDVATLVLAALEYPLLRSFSTNKRHQAVFGQRRLTYLNSNRLVRHSGWPILLQKTGYIVEAGQCMAMAVRIGGRTTVMVLLDAGSVRTRGQDARRLRDWLARQQPR